MTAVTYVTFLLTRQYTKNPELCSLGCGDEFGSELNWNGALTLYYDSVKELGRLACFKCFFFFRFEQDHFRIEYACSFYSYERKLKKRY